MALFVVLVAIVVGAIIGTAGGVAFYGGALWVVSYVSATVIGAIALGLVAGWLGLGRQ